MIKTSSSPDMPKLVSRGALLHFAIFARPPSASAPPDDNLIAAPARMRTSWQSTLLLAVGCAAAVLLSKTHASAGSTARCLALLLRLAPRCTQTEAT